MSLSGPKPMRFGVWLPVYGGWLRTVDQPSAPDVASCLAIAQQAEALGFDFLYASENLLNCIHGPQEGVVDAWSLLAAIAATTNRIGLCGAAKPGFRSPFLVARMLDTLTKVARRKLALNIICGWWKEEFELSGVSWLDHAGRYDRANAFVRDLHGLFQPPPVLHAESGDDPVFPGGEAASPEKPRSYGLDEASMPEVWIAGHSDRAIKMAAEWGNCLFLNGMPDAAMARHIEAARQEANRWGRSIEIAVNAYVVATETPEQARERWRAVLARRNVETIEFFREVMRQSGAAAWAALDEEQMVDSNAGFELGLIGSFDEIRERIPKLAEIGVDRIVCQFDDPMRDAGPFTKRVIRPIQRDAADRRVA
ncbi:LLM class flavin-dependent oxidoreductase [Hansschlegelia beijingensis]|uniref:FMNH2-dependent dimethyl sulfone monooxygenase n=1 Tax=Hansschlegelia beijingensis TaxID=1133344 RepID=A0A7W6D4M5_9HYPH|nr:LLM class flavin-dependent oxidoreductase [Hansschlegelia beijingensis]MBB3974235.1 FMNH2-dependent dimethyl sulfone monooxygenase [Hansschlegelia beijingensis]